MLLKALIWGLSPLVVSKMPCVENTPPVGFQDLAQTAPSVLQDIRYAGASNFTQAPLPGYGAESAWLVDKAAEALKRVQATLEKQGLGLLVYDAYRPQRGTAAMVAWAECLGQEALLNDGYIARHSGHNHGHTVDLTLVSQATGTPLDMGTPWDTFSEESHTLNATGTALENRLVLKRAMEAEGFRNYTKEWWHFRLPTEGTRPRDVPYGCEEPGEGSWTAPEGWHNVAYRVPGVWPPQSCDYQP